MLERAKVTQHCKADGSRSVTSLGQKKTGVAVSSRSSAPDTLRELLSTYANKRRCAFSAKNKFTHLTLLCDCVDSALFVHQPCEPVCFPHGSSHSCLHRSAFWERAKGCTQQGSRGVGGFSCRCLSL